MKKHNIEIVKMLRNNVTPMNKYDLQCWLETNLSSSDIAATVNSCVDSRGFDAHDVILSDTHGTSRKITVPTLADSFMIDSNGIYNRYVSFSQKVRFGRKNMYIVAHEIGYIY